MEEVTLPCRVLGRRRDERTAGVVPIVQRRQYRHVMRRLLLLVNGRGASAIDLQTTTVTPRLVAHEEVVDVLLTRGSIFCEAIASFAVV